VLNDIQSDLGMVAKAERLLADLPELDEIAARNRIEEVVSGYRPASTPDLIERKSPNDSTKQTQI
jgi:hypothetical protein